MLLGLYMSCSTCAVHMCPPHMCPPLPRDCYVLYIPGCTYKLVIYLASVQMFYQLFHIPGRVASPLLPRLNKLTQDIRIATRIVVSTCAFVIFTLYCLFVKSLPPFLSRIISRIVSWNGRGLRFALSIPGGMFRQIQVSVCFNAYIRAAHFFPLSASLWNSWRFSAVMNGLCSLVDEYWLCSLNTAT